MLADVNQTIIPDYSPISSKGGKRRSRKLRTTRKLRTSRKLRTRKYKSHSKKRRTRRYR